jgi:hypothetical protein
LERASRSAETIRQAATPLDYHPIRRALPKQRARGQVHDREAWRLAELWGAVEPLAEAGGEDRRADGTRWAQRPQAPAWPRQESTPPAIPRAAVWREAAPPRGRIGVVAGAVGADQLAGSAVEPWGQSVRRGPLVWTAPQEPRSPEAAVGPGGLAATRHRETARQLFGRGLRRGAMAAAPWAVVVLLWGGGAPPEYTAAPGLVADLHHGSLSVVFPRAHTSGLSAQGSGHGWAQELRGRHPQSLAPRPPSAVSVPWAAGCRPVAMGAHGGCWRHPRPAPRRPVSSLSGAGSTNGAAPVWALSHPSAGVEGPGTGGAGRGCPGTAAASRWPWPIPAQAQCRGAVLPSRQPLCTRPYRSWLPSFGSPRHPAVDAGRLGRARGPRSCPRAAAAKPGPGALPTDSARSEVDTACEAYAPAPPVPATSSASGSGRCLR